MTTGAVIFAYNNEKIDYVSLAQWSARNIERHLGIPTTIITGESSSNNTRYFSDVGTVTWHNFNRMDAYTLSPYDRTLVLDADYVVASNQLSVLLDIDQDFVCHRWAYDITGQQTFDDLNHFGRYGMPMWWATVMMFRRSQRAETIFNIMRMVRDNWDHYRNIYANSLRAYRNDHALSIALNLESGHTLESTDIPWSLASVIPEHVIEQTDLDNYTVKYYDTEKKFRRVELRNQDFHAMGKQQLGAIVESNS